MTILACQMESCVSFCVAGINHSTDGCQKLNERYMVVFRCDMERSCTTSLTAHSLDSVAVLARADGPSQVLPTRQRGRGRRQARLTPLDADGDARRKRKPYARCSTRRRSSQQERRGEARQQPQASGPAEAAERADPPSELARRSLREAGREDRSITYTHALGDTQSEHASLKSRGMPCSPRMGGTASISKKGYYDDQSHASSPC